jgi:hypothetical protein
VIGVRAKACLALSRAAQKLARCEALPRDLTEPLVARAGALHAAAQQADPGALAFVEAQCSDAHSEIIAVSTRFGCSH